MMGDGNIESPYTGRDFVQFGKTKSVLNKGAQEDALLFNPPSVLSLEIILSSFILFPPPPSFLPWFPFINSFYQTDPLKIVSTRCISPLPSFFISLSHFYHYFTFIYIISLI